MKVPLTISYHGIEKREDIDALIREEASKLERFNDHINSCRISIDQVTGRIENGGYRITIDMRVAPGHEIVVKHEPKDSKEQPAIQAIIRDGFKTARERLRRLSEQQRQEVKSHPEQQVQAAIARLQDDHGFLRSADGRDIYFHRNSVIDADFDDLRIGAGVAFSEEMGENGPQASSVRLVDARGGSR